MNFSAIFEVLAVLLEWTSEVHLQKMPTFQDSPQGRLHEQQLDFPSALVHEKCLKVSRFVCAVGNLPGGGVSVIQSVGWSVSESVGQSGSQASKQESKKASIQSVGKKN